MKTILGYAVGPIGSGLLGLITLPILTWFYPIETIAQITMLQVFTAGFVLVFSLGLDQVYVREYHATENKERLLYEVVCPSVLISLISLALLVCLDDGWVLNTLYESADVSLLWITACYALLSMVARFLSLILRMQEKSLAFSMSQIIPKVMLLVFVGVVVLSNTPANSYSLFMANLLAIIGAVLIYGWNTRADWLPIIRFKYSFKNLGSYLSYGLPLVGSGLAFWVLSSADKFLLQRLTHQSELGIYSIAISLASVAMLFSSVFNIIWAPLVYKWLQNKDVDLARINLIFENVVGVVFLLTCLAGIFAGVLTYILPAEYERVQYLIPVCLLAPCLYTLSEITGIGIAISKKTLYTMLSSIIAMLVNIGLSFLLIPSQGAFGAAIALVGAYFVFYLLRAVFSRMIWLPIKMSKANWILSILILVSVVNIYLSEWVWIRYLMWVFLIGLGIMLFKERLLFAFQQINQIRRKTNPIK